MMFQLAQINIARGRAPLTSPTMREFVDALDRINAVADAAPGFVWRYQDDSGAATSTCLDEDDPLIVVNMSVWDSVAALKAYTYRSEHTSVLRRRGEWFVPAAGPHLAMWWVPAGHRPTVQEGRARLRWLASHGETMLAFSFKHPHDAPTLPDSDTVAALWFDTNPSAALSLEGRRFAPRATPIAGDTNTDTVFAYRSDASGVRATYGGGGVEHGMIAAREQSGRLVMRYFHGIRGATKLGTAVAAVEMLDSGRVRLHERWRWDGERSIHDSVLDELA